MILGYDHMKNSKRFTQKDIVYLYSTHFASIRIEYKITSLAHHTQGSFIFLFLHADCKLHGGDRLIDCFFSCYLKVLLLC